MRVDSIGGADINKLSSTDKVQRKVQSQIRKIRSNQMQNFERNRVERSIDRMAKISNEMKSNATKRMKVFYKALEKSMFDFMG